MTAQNWPIHIILQPHLKSDSDSNSFHIQNEDMFSKKTYLRITLPFYLLLKKHFFIYIIVVLPSAVFLMLISARLRRQRCRNEVI